MNLDRSSDGSGSREDARKERQYLEAQLACELMNRDQLRASKFFKKWITHDVEAKIEEILKRLDEIRLEFVDAE